jgi:cell division protein FtsZ
VAKRNSMRDGPLAQLFKATETVSEIAAEAERAAAEPTGRASLVDAAEGRLDAPGRSPESPYLAVIRVVGVGGGGCNAVDRMIEAGVGGVEFIALNTDIQQLQMCEAPTKIQIGREDTKGLGSGADPQVGRQAAEEAHDRLKTVLRGSDMVFVTAGEGGGTGSGAAPVVARVAREVGALTVAIVTSPFTFEGTRRSEQSDVGVQALRDAADTVIVIPNDRLLEVLEKGTPLVEAFQVADDVLRQGVQGICDLITLPGLINLDFADVRTIMGDAGNAMMGIGMASGSTRAAEAATRAISSPLIDHEVHAAKGILLAISGGSDLSLHEVNEAAEIVRAAADDNTNIIFGATVDERLAGQLWVTVVATGFPLPGDRSVAPRRATASFAPPPVPEPVDLDPPDFLNS